MNIIEIINGIKPLDEDIQQEARARQDALIKPIGSLGKIEELSVRLSGITGRLYNDFSKKAIVVMCADNGVCAEGVSAAPQAITLMQALNFKKNITGVGVLSKLSGNDLVVVDIGIDSDVESDMMLNRKIRNGTGNLVKEAAMTREEAQRAVLIGFEEVEKLYKAGYTAVGTGEMGIGNTTTSSLVIMALTSCGVDEATGRGAGLTDEQYAHKKQIVERAFQLHNPDASDPIGVVATLGGLDIAGLVGVYLGAAYYRMPVVIDGIISATAALCAAKLCKHAKGYMIPSHCSEEPGYRIVMLALGMEPYFALGMRLGEGTGCPFTFLLIDAAERVKKDMATFAEVRMDNSTLVDIRE